MAEDDEIIIPLRGQGRHVALPRVLQDELRFGMSLSLDFQHYWANYRKPSKSITKRFGDKSELELDAIRLSGYIREQPDWATWIHDRTDERVSRCRVEVEEILQARSPAGLPKKIAPFTLNYVLQELSYISMMKEGALEVGTVDGTWMADNFLSEIPEMKDGLIYNAGLLESTFSVEKRRALGDDSPLCWNMVHPSMYPFAASKTLLLKAPFYPPRDEQEGRGNLLHYHPNNDIFSQHDSDALLFVHNRRQGYYPYMSERFKWLPSEFRVGADNSVRIASYINNLHPDLYSDLYSLIEGIFKEMIPLFEKVLLELNSPGGKRWRLDEMKGFVKPSRRPRNRKCQLAGKQLQVVTQFTNIHLTPEHPEYPGDYFSNVGTSNEMIVAIGIYYYSCENVADSKLEFQQNRNPSRFLATQRIGDIVVKDGRCVVFPNTLQTRNATVKLADPTQNGHRKALLFYLVDPGVRVVSTAYVSPQQKDWYIMEIMKEPVCLPEEIVEMIIDKRGWLMGLKDAQQAQAWMNMEKQRVEIEDIHWFNF